MQLSHYHKNNIEQIQQLFTNTFSDSEGQSEGLLIGNLSHDLLTNTDGHDIFCFVASEQKKIIGCIIFSRLRFEHELNAFLLGPVAIDTHYQRQGIGQKLINFGLNILRDNNVELAFTYGDPNYYSQVGFIPITKKIVRAPLKLTYPEGWLCQSFISDDIRPISGNSYCVEAINKAEYW